MKIKPLAFARLCQKHKRSLKIMKISFFMLLICFQLAAMSTKAQEAALSLKSNSLSIKSLITEIEEQTNYLVVYSNLEVDIQHLTKVRTTKGKVKDILNQAFENTNLAYSFDNNYIVLKSKDSGAGSGAYDMYEKRKRTGVVKDAEGEPIIGATVFMKNTTEGTTTDIDGRFSINASEKDVLVISFIGYDNQEVPVKDDLTFDITLQEDIKTLDEVVVIGYGTVKKKDLTGAVSIVKPEALKDRVAGDIGSALQGLASGVKVSSSGLAGDAAAITIRGIGNLTNNSPLYVIDGTPTDGNLHLNLQDIESIQVLKDASSAAIYGSRAANGVIIISTKQGKEGPLKVEFSSQIEVSWLPRYDLMNADEYKAYNNMAYDNAIRMGIEGVTSRQNHYDANTDWQDQMLKTGMMQNYNIALSGAKENQRLYTSLNVMDNSGTVEGTGYNKYAFRVNTSGKKGIFSYGENLSYTTYKRKGRPGNPFSNFISMPPTIPVLDDSHPGGYGYGDKYRASTYALNPVAMQELHTSRNKETSLRANIYGQVDLFDMFYAKLNGAYTDYSGTTNTLRKEGNWTMGQGADKPYLTKDNYVLKTVMIENTYGFKKKFDKHDLDAVVGLSYQHDKGEQHYTTRLDPLVINGEYITSIDAATGTTTGGTHVDEAALVSFLGRVNYSFDDKYLFSATVRRDGSSRFAKDNRWSTFPSVSLGWRISQENFFNVPLINDLKLRGNYGTLGGSNIGYWDYQAFINTAPRAVFGSKDDIAIGMIQSKLVNSDLKWEITKQMNFGFDLKMLKNRLSLTAEYFNSKSEDLLVYLPVLLTSGNAGGNPAVNAGSLRNQGIEFDIAWRDNIGSDFTYSASLNLSHVKNKILSLGYGQDVYYTHLSKSEIGKSLGSWYLYKMDGIFQSYDEIIQHKNSEGKIIQPNAQPGDIRYVDTNDDGVINANDRQIVGNPWPKLEMGLSLSAQYKGFDLMVNGYGKFGQEVWNGSKATAADFNINQNNFKGLKPWTPENPSTTQPRIVYGYSDNSIGDQDRWLEDGSFFRISEISIGYTVPRSLLSKIYLDSLRFGVSLRNLVTFTSYSGLDPDFKDTGVYTMGADNSSYPNPRSILFSLSLGF